MATWAIGDVTVIRIEEQIGFASLPAPGHTRGHVALWLANTAGRALFSGDVMHHALQIHAPHWNSKFCELPDVARATRRHLIEQCVEHRATLFPAHFGAPHVTRIRAVPQGFSPEFVVADRN